jgi:predicted outer membrane protein
MFWNGLGRTNLKSQFKGEGNMNRRQFTTGLLVATSAMAITRTAVAQSVPGSIPAQQYFAMASKGGMFLEETARTAFEKTHDPRLKKFSRAEVVEQVNLSDKLNKSAGGMAPMAGAAPGGIVGGVVAVPFAVAGAAVGVAGAAVGLNGAPMASDAQKAQMITQLQAMPAGPEFDAAFVQASLMGHEEAYQIHGAYAQSGDDPELRRVARGALPLIRLHISQLKRIQASMGA